MSISCSTSRRPLTLLFLLYFILFSNYIFASEQQETSDPAQILVGERLFLEIRFAQSYYSNPDKPDPVLSSTKTTATDLPGAFAGQHMNCRACHMVDEHADNTAAGMRSYADFARRPPIPMRADGRMNAPRNSQQLVNIAIANDAGLAFHFDGQFATMEALVKATLTGRNYGWLAHEQQQAIKHIADVIRSDTDKGELARESGGDYRTLLQGTSARIPADFRLAQPYRINVDQASDSEIVDAIARLIAAYVNDLAFSRDADGLYDGSPYDQFLIKNGLPRKPAKGQTAIEYSRKLLVALKQLKKPEYISASTRFDTHQQEFKFGPAELAGLKIFLREAAVNNQRVGNCISCHAAPDFTDFNFHNTGVSQIEYDAIHGNNKFASLHIPSLSERNASHNDFLPPTMKHPQASGRFIAIPTKQQPGRTDLGLWNVFANPDEPAQQQHLSDLVCSMVSKQGGLSRDKCSVEQLLPYTVARFKTPGIRDLGHSAPYMHNGMFDTLEAVLAHYMQVSTLARAGKVLNAAPELSAMYLQAEDISMLAAFLRALNEDYD